MVFSHLFEVELCLLLLFVWRIHTGNDRVGGGSPLKNEGESVVIAKGQVNASSAHNLQHR